MAKIAGLTSGEVAERREAGLTNRAPDKSSHSLTDILRANILTPFNALITALALVVILVNKSPVNSLFFIAMLLNIVIGVAQELQAKRTLDRLAILVRPTARVIRDGRAQLITSNEVVRDDIVEISLGDQLVADGEIIESEGLEINESLLTGEADPISKNSGDQVMSGSMVVAGHGIMKVTAVGAKSYSARLASEAKQFKRASSELVDSTNRILKWISWLLIIVVPILVLGQLRISHGNWSDAIIHTVAAIVGMIPEGLVLLTSMAFMLAAVKLARQQVLIQQLPAVETLARVDTLLLDKTGTITDGSMQLDRVVRLDDAGSSAAIAISDYDIETALATIASRAHSPTNDALVARFGAERVREFTREIAFSSARKWSALEQNGQVFIFGAPEIVLSGMACTDALRQARQLAASGQRVLALASAGNWPANQKLTDNLAIVPLALVILTEQIRSDAAETLDYFAKQDVAIKIISGDSPLTVGAVASSVGITAKVYDARDLPDPEQSAEANRQFLELVTSHNVFGRVKPEQKRQIAAVLQQMGHVVAMTGDGVNDALALKKADLGIAMNSGTSATKAVAEVVLMDDKFSHLPAVLGEGRRVTANIERVSNLFIVKNVYSIILSLSVTALGLTYPFMPAQMTIIGALSIGIPAFFLALAPNNRRYQPGFLRRVLSFALPVGLVTAVAMLTTYYLLQNRGLSLVASGTSVSVVTMLLGLAVLIMLAQPVRGWKLVLIAACGSVFAAILTWPIGAEKLNFSFDWSTWPVIFAVSAVAIIAVALIHRFTEKLY